jgi:hypothetical protein
MTADRLTTLDGHVKVYLVHSATRVAKWNIFGALGSGDTG